MLRITRDEYLIRLEGLQAGVQAAGLDLFVVSALDSLYYVTGAGFEPFERPFFLLVRPRQSPLLLVPKLEHEHMRKECGVAAEHIHSYWDFPAPAGRGWPEQLREHVGKVETIGVEPSLPREISEQLRGYSLRTEPLIERQRLVKSVSEVEMIRRSAEYADLGVERLPAASYFGATVAEGFAETRAVTSQIIREVDGS